MNQLLAVLGLALLPAVERRHRGVVAEWSPASDRWLNGALHAAAGVVVAVIAVEIFPEALAVLPLG